MATERARDGDPRRRSRIAGPPAAFLAVALLTGLAIWFATDLTERGGPREAGAEGAAKPVEVVARHPEAYLGERIEVRGRVARVGEDGFVLSGDAASLLVLAPTGRPFPRVSLGEVVVARGNYRRLELEEAQPLAPRLAAVGDGRALVAIEVDPLDDPRRARRP